MRVSVILTIVILTATSASWVCPVFRAEEVDPSHPGDLPATAALKSLEVVITPSPVENETMREHSYADWDYMISERLSITPLEGSGSILFCVDLGVVPEGVRDMLSVTVDGLELDPCSVIARPCYPADMIPGADTLFILRKDPWHPSYVMYVLDNMQDYRSHFNSEEHFHEAVPETARFYSLLYEVPSNGDQFDVEIVYLVMGWTYLCGAEPLQFTLLQPGLWAGAVDEISFLIDLSVVPDREGWTIGFMGEEFGGDRTLRLYLEDFDIFDITQYPILSITPSDLPVL